MKKLIIGLLQVMALSAFSSPGAFALERLAFRPQIACPLYNQTLTVTCGTLGNATSMGYLSLTADIGDIDSEFVTPGYPQKRTLYRLHGSLNVQPPGSSAPENFEVEGSYREQGAQGEGWSFLLSGLTIEGGSLLIKGSEFGGSQITWDGGAWAHPCSITQ